MWTVLWWFYADHRREDEKPLQLMRALRTIAEEQKEERERKRKVRSTINNNEPDMQCRYQFNHNVGNICHRACTCVKVRCEGISVSHQSIFTHIKWQFLFLLFFFGQNSRSVENGNFIRMNVLYLKFIFSIEIKSTLLTNNNEDITIV